MEQVLSQAFMHVTLLASTEAGGGNAAADFANQFGLAWPQFISQLVIFLILFLVLRRYAFKPITAVLAERQRVIEESVTNAERVRQELEAAEKSRAEIMARAGAEGNRLIEEAKKSADSIGSKKIQEAVQQAEALIRKAEEAAAQDRERMMVELKQELGRLVVATTTKVVGRVLTPEDQERLQKETLQNLGR